MRIYNTNSLTQSYAYGVAGIIPAKKGCYRYNMYRMALKLMENLS